jgi:hypothetical protein
MKIFTEYEERLRTMPYVPGFSYVRQMLRDGSGPNMFFFMYLFCHQPMAIEFLKGIGLLRCKMQYNACGPDMTSADSNLPEGFRWRCQKRVAGVSSNQSASIKQGSWFQLSTLSLQKILLVTHDILCPEPALFRHLRTDPLPSDHL